MASSRRRGRAEIARLQGAVVGPTARRAHDIRFSSAPLFDGLICVGRETTQGLTRARCVGWPQRVGVEISTGLLGINRRYGHALAPLGWTFSSLYPLVRFSHDSPEALDIVGDEWIE